MESFTTAQIAEDAQRVAAMADAQGTEDDPLGLAAMPEESSSEEEVEVKSSSSSDDDMKGLTQDFPVEAIANQRKQRKILGSNRGAPPPPYSMESAARSAAAQSEVIVLDAPLP